MRAEMPPRRGELRKSRAPGANRLSLSSCSRDIRRQYARYLAVDTRRALANLIRHRGVEAFASAAITAAD
jgi:hypothetical protein